MDPLKLIQRAWVIEAALIVLTTVVLIFALPERMPVWVSALPLLGVIIAAQGGAAFGGPALKRAQEAHNGGSDPTP